MKSSASRYVGLVIAFVIGFLLLFGIERGVSSANQLGAYPNVMKATKTGPHTAKLTLYTMPDAVVCHPSSGHFDWVTYCPTTALQVPARSVITVTVKQFDSGSPVHNVFFDQVHGTLGGKATLNGKAFTKMPNVNIGHTFTIQPANNSPRPMFLSVPLEGLPDESKQAPIVTQKILGKSYNTYQAPNIIKFKFRSGPKGDYVWKCYVPCGSGLSGFEEGFGGPMGTLGYMLGKLTVK